MFFVAAKPRGKNGTFGAAKNGTYFAKSKRRYFCPTPLLPGQDRFKQLPTPGPEGLDLSRRLPGAAMERGQIEPCINSLLANPASGQELSFKSRNTSLIEFDYIFIFCLSGLSLKAVRQGSPPATMNMSPGYFHRKQTENLFSIPRLQIEHVLGNSKSY